MLLVLRGDADWPENVMLVEDEATAGAIRTPAFKPQTRPVSATVSGSAFDLYAIPLDLGRTIRVGGDGQACAQRQCVLLALGQRVAPGQSLRELSPVIRTTFFALSVLLLLLIPMLKLRAIDQNGSLHWVEVAALIASVPLALATLALLFATIGHWFQLRHEWDARAMSEASVLAGELEVEVQKTLNKALLVGDCLRAEGGDACGKRGPKLVAPLLSANLRNLHDSAVFDERSYPSNSQPAATVADRRYFRKLATGEGLSPLDQNWRSAVAKVPSIIDGSSRLVVVLRRDPIEQARCREEDPPPDIAETDADRCFILMSKELTSTLERPMPPGFGYAVIDPESMEVIEHSDASRIHSQHFDEQIGKADWLATFRDAMAAKCARRESNAPASPISTLYAGDSVRMALATACKPGWIVATWYSKARAQQQVTFPTRLASGVVMLIALVTALLALATGTLDRDRLIATVWPRPDNMDARPATPAQVEGASANRELAAGLPWLTGYLLVGIVGFGGDLALWHAAMIVLLTALAFYRGYYARRARATINLASCALVLLVGIFSFAFASQVPGIAYAAYLLSGIALAWNVRRIGAAARNIGFRLGQRSRNGYLRFAILIRRISRRSFARNQRAGEAALPSRWRRRRLRRAKEVEAVATKTASVRRVQIWAMLLLAVLPVVSGYRAAYDAVEDATREHAGFERNQAEIEAFEAIGQMQRDRSSEQNAKSPAEQCKDVADRSIWPCTSSGEKDPEGGATEVRRWLGEQAAADERWIEPAQADAPDAKAAPRFVRVAASTDAPAAKAAARDRLGSAKAGFVALVLALAFAGFSLTLLAMLNHNLFGLHHFEFRSLHPRMTAYKLIETSRDSDIRKILFIDFPWTEYEALKDQLSGGAGFELLHLGQLRDDQTVRSAATLGRKPWVVLGFESIISNNELRQRALLLMERLMSQPEAEIYFFSEMLPIARLKHQRDREKEERRSAGVESRGFESEAFRWAELFESFATFRHEEAEDPEHKLEVLFSGSTDAQNRLKLWREQTGGESRVIDEELRAIPSTKVKKQRITFTMPLPPAATPSGTSPAVASPGRRSLPPTREQIYEYLANFLGDYYQSQWVRSSKEEHLVMHHLAHGRFVNADNFSVINNLLTRGLVKRDPNFQLMNQSFAYWIRMLEHPRWFERYRHEVEHGGTWRQLRVPVLMIVVIAGVGGAYLDQGMTGSLVTLVPAIAASVPLIFGRFIQARQGLAA